MAATGQSAGPEEQDLMRGLAAKLEALEKRVRELEARGAEPARSAAPALAPPDLAPSEHAGHDLGAEAGGAAGGPNLRVRGFADVGYSASHNGPAPNSFALGQFDLFITSRLSPSLGVLVETVFEHGLDNSTQVDLERALVQYHPSRYFNADVGRYHSMIGYYNAAFHHGTWFQTAIGRPALFAFEDEGGLLPVHNVGVSLSGRVPSGPANLSYVFELGNGRSYRPSAEAVQNRREDNSFKAFNIGVAARPLAFTGWRAGASLYHDRLALDGASVQQNIVAAYVVYQLDRTEFLNEAAWMHHAELRHRELGSAGATSIPAWYSQFSYRFGAVRPYVRYEWRNAPGRDPVVRSTGTEPGRAEAASLGARYDFSEFMAFKAQLSRRQDQSRTFLQTALQLAFTF